jgi:Cysteine-rich CPCC
MHFVCPCCGYLTLAQEPPGTYQQCPLCKWHDDDLQYTDPSYRGGPNTMSLVEAQAVLRAAPPDTSSWQAPDGGPQPHVVDWLNYPAVWDRVVASARARGHRSERYRGDKGIHCCKQMALQVERKCSTHAEPFDCPDHLIDFRPGAGYQIVVHDGGVSGVSLNYCPWCGTQLREVREPRKVPVDLSGPAMDSN